MRLCLIIASIECSRDGQVQAKATVCLPWTNNFFVFSLFYVLIGVLLQGMVESCLLSKDELLTPNIDEVMVV